MKLFVKVLTLGMLIAVIMSGCAGPTASGPLTKIRIATDPTYPPFESVKRENRQIVGFDVEVMKAIAARENLSVEFVSTNYQFLTGSVARCEVDGAISAMEITDELRQSMSLTDSYYSVGLVVAVKKGNLAITGRDSLAGMVVGAQRGQTGAAELQKLPGVQTRLYDSFDLAFQDLIIGMIDAVVADSPQVMDYASTPANNLQVVGGEFSVRNYAIGVCPRNPELLKKMNDGLAAIKADGTLEKLRQTWVVNGVE
jgi:polar amino acid transport system substrate-binding protein